MKRQKSFPASKGTLYLVATPIGNLEDFSPRGRECLQLVDIIAAEDTRHTRKLLTAFQIRTPLISLHEHNERKRSRELVERLKAGEDIALVSDAGLPALSDPGETLVQLAIQEDIPVVTIPGPNAALTALIASGIATIPFTFLGFLPRQAKERRKALKRWAQLPTTLVFYEAPHRLIKSLQDVLDILGNRRIAVARELTKRHEEWLRGRVEEVLRYIEEGDTKGEYTVVVEGGNKQEKESQPWDDDRVIQQIEHYVKQGLATKEAIRKTAKECGLPKREVYQLYHEGKTEPMME